MPSNSSNSRMEYYNFNYVPEKINHYEKLLYEAINSNNLKQTKFLLQLKVNPNAIIHGYPLLIGAIFKNNLSLVNLLLTYKANPNLANLSLTTTLIYTPLYVAVWFGNYEIVLTLLEHGANLDENHIDNFGAKLLHTAVFYGYSDITQLLLVKGFNPNSLTKNLQTPLHIAVIKQNIAIIKLLLTFNADPNLIDSYNYTPISLAATYNNQEIIKLFENATSNTSKKKLLINSNNSLSILNHFQNSFSNSYDIINILIDDKDNYNYGDLLENLKQKLELIP